MINILVLFAWFVFIYLLFLCFDLKMPVLVNNFFSTI